MFAASVIDVNGCKLHVRRSGKGAPLLFLHGAQGIGAWPKALGLLAERFELIVPDHPGFGLSESADWIDDVSDLALFYRDALEALQLRSAHIAGHSIGGWIALDMAIHSSERLESLTLISSAGIRVKGVPPADMFICGQEELGQLLFFGKAWSDWRSEWSSPELNDIYDRNRSAAAKLSWQPRLFDPRLEKWLHRVCIPTHILWGAEDKVIPPVYAAAFNRLIRDSQVRILPECGHVAHIEAPDVFAAAVTKFIEGLS